MTTSSLMASAISSSSSSSSLASRRLSVTALSFSSISVSHNPKVHFFKWIPYSGLSSWNGLKQLSISKSQFSVQIGRSRKNKGKGVYASLFGVGAPEALVIGVVALLVFGPKGLAELKFEDFEVVNFKSFSWVQVARNLGKTLREFQPTIRELQDVSREFKSTLEREIGLDDIKGSGQDTRNSSTMRPSSDSSSNDSVADPNGSPSPKLASTAEDDLERMMRIADAEKQAEKDLAALLESPSESQTVSQDAWFFFAPDGTAQKCSSSIWIFVALISTRSNPLLEFFSPLPSCVNVSEVADNSSSSDRAYSTEEYLKISEEQLKAAAQKQNETSTLEQIPFNAQSPSQVSGSSQFIVSNVAPRLILYTLHTSGLGRVVVGRHFQTFRPIGCFLYPYGTNWYYSKIADRASSADGAYSTEDLSKAAAQQNEMSSPQQIPSNAESQSQEAPGEAASMISSSTKPESET
ncbi:hypothetical protein MTR67_013956 [Solanum verrucosum]|uniref:HCF106 n=1 Tax=Solanum verrucosum TaxID=315347 RepID=A0AAF0TIE8_SOLVR|nr:hypothetical protein MTR67_013956 [Solanum verrucosum]